MLYRVKVRVLSSAQTKPRSLRDWGFLFLIRTKLARVKKKNKKTKHAKACIGVEFECTLSRSTSLLSAQKLVILSLEGNSVYSSVSWTKMS